MRSSKSVAAGVSKLNGEVREKQKGEKAQLNMRGSECMMYFGSGSIIISRGPYDLTILYSSKQRSSRD